MKIEIGDLRHKINRFKSRSPSLEFTASVLIDGKPKSDITQVMTMWHGKERDIKAYYPMIEKEMISWIKKKEGIDETESG